MRVRFHDWNRRFVAPAAGLVLLALVAGFAGGCASTADPAEEGTYDTNDPLETYNRAMLEVNRTLDGLLLKPMAEIYVGVLPGWVQQRVTNVLNNMGEPVNFANNLLQGELERAGITAGRFAINTTVGLAGIFEVADEFGLTRKDEDFGQTLAVWGVGEGPYLMLPLFGPSNPRDAVGLIVGWFMDPFTYILDSDFRLIRTAARGIEQRAANLENIEALEETSIDFYAALRELYRQHRGNQIRNGELPPTMPIPSVTMDDFVDDREEQMAGQFDLSN